MHTTFRTAALLAPSSLTAVSLCAQSYLAQSGDGDTGTLHTKGTSTSSHLVSIGGIHWAWWGHDCDGWARCSPYALEGGSFAQTVNSNSKQGYGRAIRQSDDLVFSDGGTAIGSTTVQFNFTVSGTVTGPLPLGAANVPLLLRVSADGASWNQKLGTLGASQPVQSSVMTVLTNTPVTVIIRADYVANSWELRTSPRQYPWQRVVDQTLWASTPFVLAPGIRVDSAMASIVKPATTSLVQCCHRGCQDSRSAYRLCKWFRVGLVRTVHDK